MSDFDLCKENIQPQRRGHSSAELENLARLEDPEYRARVKSEEAEWEKKLRVDDTDVNVWSDYINWAETNLYSHVQLNELKQKALAKFIKPDFENLANSEILFEIFLKTLDKSKNWRDLFSFVRSKGFFHKLSSFWTHWAERFEMDGCVKQADSILEQGESYLSGHQEELKKLEQWRQNFDLRIASGRSLHIEREEEVQARPARRGLGLVESKPTLKTTTQKVKKKQKNLFVYEDDGKGETSAGLTGNWVSDTLPRNTNTKGKENNDFAKPWTEPSPMDVLVTKPRVEILEIPEESEENNISKQKKFAKKALKVKKAATTEVFMQLIQNEETKSKEIPMYRKNEIYLGLKETSFEELKAQKWAKLQNIAKSSKTPVQKKITSDKISSDGHLAFNMDDSFSDLENCEDLLDGNDDLVCGRLPDTPKAKTKFSIFEE